MVVRQKDVPQLRQRNTCQHELARDAVTAIDYVRRIVHYDHLGRRRTCLSRSRAAAGAKQDQPALVALGCCQARQERATEKRGRCLENTSPGAPVFEVFHPFPVLGIRDGRRGSSIDCSQFVGVVIKNRPRRRHKKTYSAALRRSRAAPFSRAKRTIWQLWLPRELRWHSLLTARRNGRSVGWAPIPALWDSSCWGRSLSACRERC